MCLPGYTIAHWRAFLVAVEGAYPGTTCSINKEGLRKSASTQIGTSRVALELARKNWG